MKTFISVAEARAIVLSRVDALPSESIPVKGALGRTLRTAIVSRDNIPPFDNSAMDGYAVRSADLAALPKVLRVIDDIRAGTMPKRAVEPGACARIMTGAPSPPGADAVAPVEWTQEQGPESVVFHRAPRPGEHIRRAAEDVRAGDTVMEPGRIITPPMIGMMTALGYPTVEVGRHPRVAVVSTGDELSAASEALSPGKIRDSNGPALAAQVVSAGGEALEPLRASDDPQAIRRSVETALAADVLVFSGGVSVGTHDFVKEVLDEMGMETLFWKVRQRPGKPLAFGLLRKRLVFGLPGNPVSSAICFEQYVRPAIAKMLGRATLMRPHRKATLAASARKKAGLHYIARGIASFGPSGALEVRDTGPQASNLYSSMMKANCLFHMEESMENPAAGTRVDIEWLTW